MAVRLMFTLLCLLFNGFYFTIGDNKLLTLPGHLQRLGSHGPSVDVETVDRFPEAKDFFDNYVFQSKPVKIKGAVLDAFPRVHWTDDYFLSLSLPNNHTVRVESGKKQDIKSGTVGLHFQRFVEQYNTTRQYMVASIPDFLGKDVILPDPLHCAEIYKQNILDSYMWYGSGGTTSVLHTDSADIINCVYDGTKTFVMIDPNKYYEKVVLDVPMSQISQVDVERVDYEKYPGLAEVEFTITNVTAGDCIFLPYKWYHSVRSYSRNIGLSTAWDHYKVTPAEIAKCNYRYDPTLSLDKITFTHYRLELIITNIRGIFLEITKKEAVTVKTYDKVILNEFVIFLGKDVVTYMKQLGKITGSVDKDSNGVITASEVNNATIKEITSFLLGDNMGSLELFRKITDIVDKNKDGIITRTEVDDLNYEEWLFVKKQIIEQEKLLIDVQDRLIKAKNDYTQQASEGYKEGLHNEL